MSSNYRLVMRTGANPGQIFPLDQTEMYIGRDLSCEIVINDSEVSRRHSKIYIFGQSFVIEDLGSTNGTFVNGQRITGPHTLIPGEIVALGDSSSLQFEVSMEDPDATRVAVSPPTSVVEQPFQQAPYQPQMATPTPPQQSFSTPPVYAGQVPSSSNQIPQKPKKKNRLWLIVLLLVILIVCACIVAFIVIDQLNWYCDLVPGIMNSVFGAGSCP